MKTLGLTFDELSAFFFFLFVREYASRSIIDALVTIVLSSYISSLYD